MAREFFYWLLSLNLLLHWYVIIGRLKLPYNQQIIISDCLTEKSWGFVIWRQYTKMLERWKLIMSNSLWQINICYMVHVVHWLWQINICYKVVHWLWQINIYYMVVHWLWQISICYMVVHWLWQIQTQYRRRHHQFLELQLSTLSDLQQKCSGASVYVVVFISL